MNGIAKSALLRFTRRTFDADNRGRTPPPDANANVGERTGARAMTMHEMVTVHGQIERENARKLREWMEHPHTWAEQVDTRLANLRLADDEISAMRKMGVIA